MQLNFKHTTLLFSLCAVFAACNENEKLIDIPLEDKTPIVLSIGGVDAPEATTKAVITDGTEKTLNPFDVNSKIFMVMKSEYDTGNPDFGGARTTKYNVARGDVNTLNNDNNNHRSLVEFDAKNQRYWDDAHARSSMLSIYAYAQKGQSTWLNCTFNGHEYKTEADATQPYAWTTTEIAPTILTWSASHLGTPAQNVTSVLSQDLLFSNNLANNDTDPSTDPTKDKRLKFNFSTRKFPDVGEANMIFYHAMSKITIKIIEGEGFDKTSANKANDFKFTTTGGNIILKQFNHTGKFDITQGEFTEIATNGTTDIPSIYLKSTNTNATGTEPHYVLEALAVPSIANNGKSRFVKDAKALATDVIMEFAIDNNTFQITSGQLYDALHADGDPTHALVSNATEKTDNGNYIPLEAGKNYVLTFTVGKTKIKNLTAQVVGWEDVEAEPFNPSNARIKLQLEERGTAQTSDVAFYKAEDNKTTDGIDDDYTTWNWKTGYTNLGATYSTDHWTTDKFWQSNKDFYHFRALMPAATSVITDGSVDGDYTTLTSAASYTDICWGAPMLDDGVNETAGTFKWNYGPTSKGFDGKDDATTHQIYKAIGPTEDPIKLILFHMMSELTINIKTSTGSDAVDLGDDSSNKTKVELVNYKTGGKLLLGNGLVTSTGDPTTAEIAQKSFTAAVATPATSAIVKYVYGAVPQDLTNVTLVITTPDHNQYKIAMKDVLATTVTNNNIANPYIQVSGSSPAKYTINRWYPGFKYTYTFTLKKKGIVDLEATIVDWENVEAGDDNVQIQ